MKALKNVKMGWKLFALSLPLVIAIIVSVIVTGLKIKNTEAEVTSVYYDMLYKVNNHLVSAQSDLYRTLNGATYYYNYHGTSGMFESMVTTNLNYTKPDDSHSSITWMQRQRSLLLMKLSTEASPAKKVLLSKKHIRHSLNHSKDGTVSMTSKQTQDHGSITRPRSRLHRDI